MACYMASLNKSGTCSCCTPKKSKPPAPQSKSSTNTCAVKPSMFFDASPSRRLGFGIRHGTIDRLAAPKKLHTDHRQGRCCRELIPDWKTWRTYPGSFSTTIQAPNTFRFSGPSSCVNIKKVDSTKTSATSSLTKLLSKTSVCSNKSAAEVKKTKKSPKVTPAAGASTAKGISKRRGIASQSYACLKPTSPARSLIKMKKSRNLISTSRKKKNTTNQQVTRDKLKVPQEAVDTVDNKVEPKDNNNNYAMSPSSSSSCCSLEFGDLNTKPDPNNLVEQLAKAFAGNFSNRRVVPKRTKRVINNVKKQEQDESKVENKENTPLVNEEGVAVKSGVDTGPSVEGETIRLDTASVSSKLMEAKKRFLRVIFRAEMEMQAKLQGKANGPANGEMEAAVENPEVLAIQATVASAEDNTTTNATPGENTQRDSANRKPEGKKRSRKSRSPQVDKQLPQEEVKAVAVKEDNVEAEDTSQNVNALLLDLDDILPRTEVQISAGAEGTGDENSTKCVPEVKRKSGSRRTSKQRHEKAVEDIVKDAASVDTPEICEVTGEQKFEPLCPNVEGTTTTSSSLEGTTSVGMKSTVKPEIKKKGRKFPTARVKTELQDKVEELEEKLPTIPPETNILSGSLEVPTQETTAVSKLEETKKNPRKLNISGNAKILQQDKVVEDKPKIGTVSGAPGSTWIPETVQLVVEPSNIADPIATGKDTTSGTISKDVTSASKNAPKKPNCQKLKRRTQRGILKKDGEQNTLAKKTVSLCLQTPPTTAPPIDNIAGNSLSEESVCSGGRGNARKARRKTTIKSRKKTVQNDSSGNGTGDEEEDEKLEGNVLQTKLSYSKERFQIPSEECFEEIPASATVFVGAEEETSYSGVGYRAPSGERNKEEDSEGSTVYDDYDQAEDCLETESEEEDEEEEEEKIKENEKKVKVNEAKIVKEKQEENANKNKKKAVKKQGKGKEGTEGMGPSEPGSMMGFAMLIPNNMQQLGQTFMGLNFVPVPVYFGNGAMNMCPPWVVNRQWGNPDENETK